MALFSWWKNVSWTKTPPSQAYASLRENADDDDNHLSTDSETRSSFPEKGGASTKEYFHPRTVYMLSATILVLFCILIIQNFPIKKLKKNEEAMYYSPIPEFPIQIKKFEYDQRYIDSGTEASVALWSALKGPTPSQKYWSRQGFIVVDNSQQQSYPGIGPGMSAGNMNEKQKYGVSMFHQLHCLVLLRNITLSLLDGSLDAPTFLISGANTTDENTGTFFPGGEVPAGFGFWHVKHCFNYIRQGIQCAGDMSLEWPTFISRDKPLVLGWDVPHRCRDWDAAWGYMEMHKE